MESHNGGLYFVLTSAESQSNSGPALGQGACRIGHKILDLLIHFRPFETLFDRHSIAITISHFSVCNLHMNISHMCRTGSVAKWGLFSQVSDSHTGGSTLMTDFEHELRHN